MFTSQPRVAGVLTRSAATVRKGTRRLTVIAAAPAFGLSLLLGSAPRSCGRAHYGVQPDGSSTRR